jgi:hypothetical protein
MSCGWAPRTSGALQPEASRWMVGSTHVVDQHVGIARQRVQVRAGGLACTFQELRSVALSDGSNGLTRGRWL